MDHNNPSIYTGVSVIVLLSEGMMLTILLMMIAVKAFPDGVSDNALVQKLLSHVTIQSSESDNSWLIKYPYPDGTSLRFTDIAEQQEKRIENYCTSSFPLREEFHSIATYLKENIYHYHLDDIEGFYEAIEYVTGPENNVKELKAKVEEMDIPFLYVNTPDEDTTEYYQDMKNNHGVLSLRDAVFMQMLEQDGIETLNIPKDYPFGILYDTTEHWFAENGFQCSNLIASWLNNNGFDFSNYPIQWEQFVDYLDFYPEFADRIRESCGYNYSLPAPMDPGNYKVIQMESDVYQGSFYGALITGENEWNADGSAYHELLRVNNLGVFEILNLEPPANLGKRILIIGDSFSWPVVTYLSTGTERTAFLYNPEYTGSILGYINVFQPDAVIMVYHVSEFQESTTELSFDLR